MARSWNPRAPRSGRLVRTLILAACVAILISVLYGAPGLFPRDACGCASTPTHPPGWTPWPVSRDQAAETASRLAGVSVHDWSNELTVSGRPLYEAQGTTAIAFVDADSGAVLEVVIEDQLPVSDATVVSIEAARATAESFLARGNIGPSGLAEAARLVRQATVAYFDITWTEPGATTPGLEVLVNPSSGGVFGYRELRTGFALAMPVVGHAAAMRLAGVSTYAGGATPDPADQPLPEFEALDVNFNATDGHEWTWSVTFPGGLVMVDAVEGEAWVSSKS